MPYGPAEDETMAEGTGAPLLAAHPFVTFASRFRHEETLDNFSNLFTINRK
jgi:hypothetical protein